MFSSLPSVNALAADNPYEAQVAQWRSYEDVAKWLKNNFVFDKSRQAQLQAQLKVSGPENVLTRNPETFFQKPYGHCRDASSLAKDALNRINPDYQARYIFIKNKYGPPNHWVTGFTVDKQLYVMDYGTGKHWSAMEGLHGPYASLEEYKTFLASLSMSGFAPEVVRWRDIPGQLD